MLNENTKKVSYITEGTVIKGDVTTNSALIVKGTVEGNVTSTDDVEVRGNVTGGIKANNVNIAGCNIAGDITCTGNLFVDKISSVTGNVNANQIKVSGAVNGQIVVNNTAEFLSSSNVVGDVYAASVAIEHGAKIKGFLDIRGEEEAPVVTPQQVNTPAYQTYTAPTYVEPQQTAVATESSDDMLFEELK